MTPRGRAGQLASDIEHIDVTHTDDRVARAYMVDSIRRRVSFDYYAFLLTDPVTTVGCSPVAAVPDVAALPDLIRLKYLTAINRWTGLPAIGCATLQHATAGRPERSLVWREQLAGHGVVDVLSVVFVDRYGCWGFLDLWRLATHFTEHEVAALAMARAAITSRLRALQAASFTSAEPALRRRGPGALVLSADLEVRAQTPQTHDWLATLVPAESGRGVVPAGAYNVAAQLLANHARVDDHPAMARVHLDGGAWLTLRADRLAGKEDALDGDIAVTIEPSSGSERREMFSHAYGLTPREDQLLRYLADGADTRAVATLMSITELTVQDHLKTIFTKTNTGSRREVLAAASGT